MKHLIPGGPPHAAHPARRWRRTTGLIALGGLGLGVLLFWSPLQRELTMRLVLQSENPDEAVVQDLLAHARDPTATLERLWRTQKIPHRLWTMNYLKGKATSGGKFEKSVETMVLGATEDVDFAVKELAFGTLAARNDPRIFAAAREQLLDSDPEGRALGLRYLRMQKDSALVPALIRLLDDAEPSVVTSASAVLQSWTGQDFGIRQRMAIAALDTNDVSVATDNEQKLADGVRRWKAWWAAHKQEYLSEAVSLRRGAVGRLPAQDFALAEWSGGIVRLSQFRGKVVLLNFWTTWCPACLVEIPHLIELQRRNPDRLVVVGISLDGMPEDDGHGHEHGEKHAGPDAARLRRLVSGFVMKEGINYRVLLDPEASVGCQYNGNELPTNVLIDSDGCVRRRFVGGRSVAAFEAMVREVDRGEERPN